MPGPINRTRPGVTEGWWLGLTMCVTLTSRIFSQQPGRWSVRFAHRPRLARIAHIRKGTKADGFPAVLAHHRAVAAMLALSVEGFLPMPYTVWCGDTPVRAREDCDAHPRCS